MASAQSRCPVLDIVGIGFGPSNLALAIAVAEHNAQARPEQRLSARFVERKQEFGWHRGMLIENATMQVSFLKDLATLRNPVSPFSFVAYLHDRGRLVDFINHKTLFPTRVEFHDYLSWAAARFEDVVDYDVEVIEVRPVTSGGQIGELDVIGMTAQGRQQLEWRTRNVVIATGITPSMPSGVKRSDRVIHSNDLLEVVNRGDHADPRSVVVIGAGQSAAEVAAYLYSRFDRATIYTIYERYGYSPSDDSPFANQVFDPAAVDMFYHAPAQVQQKFYDYHSNTNYSVVDPELIDELYRITYREKVTGQQRLEILRMSRVQQLTPTDDGARLLVESGLDGSVRELAADLVVCATGYDAMDTTGLLTGVRELCPRDADGRLGVARNYRIRTSDDMLAGLYLEGGTEHTHGLSSSLLSNVSVRAGEILDAIVAGSAANTDKAESTERAGG